MESRGAANGERKTITALFADLKGSTALIEGLDPEDARAIIDPALQLMMDAVHRYDGYVSQSLGDGIFALFGAPIAHEDHPQRALYAALRMQEEMRGYADTLREQGRPPLMMRVGINTGEVVLRSIRKDDLHTDYVPVGHSTNLAARMEQLASSGSILVSDYTHKLTDGYFEFKDLRKTQIKGVDEPLRVYEVTGAGPLRTRLQVSARRGLTRFVGRHSEMEQTQAALDQAKAGHGQIVGVMGEPGLGKSRLFYEFKLASQSEYLVFEAFAASHGKASPFLPLIELLKNYFQIEPTDDERQWQSKVMGQVLTLDRSLEDTLPYLFPLLGIEDQASSLQQMDAQIRRQRTFEALKKLFLRESLNQPLILIFEDLHWIDMETQGFLDVLSESIASAQVVLLVNYRPEYQHQWGTKTYYTQLHLAPLGQAEAEELLAFLLGNDDSLKALKSLILERTEGTPFFMEEVVQTLVEEGALIGDRGHYRLETAPAELHIPQTVQGILAARIDRLSVEEKTFLQQLAVIGRQFPASLIKHVVDLSEDALYRVLAALQGKEFLYEPPAFPEVEYIFKHALTQDVAYGTVLHEQRKVSHERTAQALEALHSDSLDDHYSALAHHYSLSDDAEKAMKYLSLAGQRAVQRSAHEEGARCFMAALELLSQSAETLNRTRQELVLQTALGHTLSITRGFGAPQAERALTRARELCEQVGQPTQLMSILVGLGHAYNNVDLEKALASNQQLLDLCQQDSSLDGLPDAYMMLATSYFVRGDLVRTREATRQGLHHYNPVRHRAHAVLYGQDSGVLNSVYSSMSQWYLGYQDQAVQQADQTLTLARDVGHPFSLCNAVMCPGVIKALRREAHPIQEQADALIAVAEEHGFPIYLAYGTLLRGYALALQG